MSNIASTFQPSESFAVGMFLAISGGFLDAYTYIARGGVFANAQTGNMARLGLSLAEQDWHAVGFYLIPISAFAVGIFLAQAIRTLLERNPYFHWRQLILLLEVLILCATAFVPAGQLDSYVNVAISFVCALQGESFRKIHGNTLATTMCTGNLRSATEYLYQSLDQKNKKYLVKSLQYVFILFFFVTGAFLGGCCTNHLGTMGTLIPAALLLVPFFIMQRKGAPH